MAVAISGHPGDRDRAAHDRWIAWALLASLLLHSPLFLPSGAWRLGLPSDTPAPTLEVRIEQSVTQHDDGSTDDASPVLDDRVLSRESVDARQPPDLPAEPVQRVVDNPAPPDGLDADAPTDLLETAPVPVEADTQTAPSPPAPVETPESEGSYAEATESGEPPPADVVVATVPPADAVRLTRRIAREAQGLLGSGAMQGELTFKDQQRSFAAVFTRQLPSDETGIERVTVDVTTDHGSERMQTRLQMKRLTFSHFTQLVDRWDESVQLHDDEIVGRFHSNSVIHLTYDKKIAPRLFGKVTTTRGILINDAKGWRSRHEIFSGGLDTRSSRIRLPAIALPTTGEGSTSNGDVHVVQSDTLLVFHADGNYDRVEVASGATSHAQLAGDRLTYIIGAPGIELHVRGVVNGSVTVYSPERIVVQGNLTYANGSPSGRVAGAYLGLVSDGNVEIDRPEVTGPGDLEINGAVYARKRFVVRDAGQGQGPQGPATLFIRGSLTAGSLARTEPRYATRIEFDPRFERARPPGFPQTDRYEVETWDERWHVTDASPSSMPQ